MTRSNAFWLIEPVPAWLPTRNQIARLSARPNTSWSTQPSPLGSSASVPTRSSPEHAVGPPVPRDGTLLGGLFESLVTLGLRVYAQQSEANVKHLRTFSGDHEVDLIVERADGRIVAFEIKLTSMVDDDDVRHLNWLAARGRRRTPRPACHLHRRVRVPPS